MTHTSSVEVHALLRTKARAWLESYGCTFIAPEVKIAGAEHGDALGWTAQRQSVFIQIATTRAAFFERREAFKEPAHRLGDYRLVLTLPDLIKKPAELLPGWGLMTYQPGGQLIRNERNPYLQNDKNITAEMEILSGLIADSAGGQRHLNN